MAVALEADMDLHTGERTVGELTWAHNTLGKRPTPKNELCGNENGKCTGKQPVLLGHSIYPNARLISKRTLFDTERTAGP